MRLKIFQLESEIFMTRKISWKIAKSVEHVWLDRHLTLPKINVSVIVLYLSQFCSTQLFRTRGICCNFVGCDSSQTRALKADTKWRISNNVIKLKRFWDSFTKSILTQFFEDSGVVFCSTTAAKFDADVADWTSTTSWCCFSMTSGTRSLGKPPVGRRAWPTKR